VAAPVRGDPHRLAVLRKSRLEELHHYRRLEPVYPGIRPVVRREEGFGSLAGNHRVEGRGDCLVAAAYRACWEEGVVGNRRLEEFRLKQMEEGTVACLDLRELFGFDYIKLDKSPVSVEKKLAAEDLRGRPPGGIGAPGGKPNGGGGICPGRPGVRVSQLDTPMICIYVSNID
jgi:hypothetical protein